MSKEITTFSPAPSARGLHLYARPHGSPRGFSVLTTTPQKGLSHAIFHRPPAPLRSGDADRETSPRSPRGPRSPVDGVRLGRIEPDPVRHVQPGGDGGPDGHHRRGGRGRTSR